MKLTWMWCLGMAVIIGLLGLTGCSKTRWYPTDPRLETPNPQTLVVDESWRMNVGTTITASTE